jgi:hypothetical protein
LRKLRRIRLTDQNGEGNGVDWQAVLQFQKRLLPRLRSSFRVAIELVAAKYTSRRLPVA